MIHVVDRATVEHLRSLVLRHGGERALTCPQFEPGGKQRGVGIPSDLWCRACGCSHDVHVMAAALEVTAAVVERDELPLLAREVS